MQCRSGQFQLCPNQPFVGSSRDGGYAEYMLAKSSSLIAIPDELDALKAAPLLCAGVATFNALKKFGAEAGDLVAIAGIGGLGHMALQYARKMGFHVIALGRRQSVSNDAIRFGAHRFCNIDNPDLVPCLKALGGPKAIISTIGNAAVNALLIGALAPEGRLVLLSGGKEPVPVPAGQLIIGERSVTGSITGTPHETERTLKFSFLADIQPQIEQFPLGNVLEAYARLKSGQARFRVVLTMQHN